MVNLDVDRAGGSSAISQVRSQPNREAAQPRSVEPFVERTVATY